MYKAASDLVDARRMHEMAMAPGQIDDGQRKEAPRRFYYITIMKVVHTYGEFESFGELALIQNKRRAARLEVSQAGDAHFAVMSKKDYRSAQGKTELEDLQNKKNFLKRFFIFKLLSDSAITSLVKNMEEVHCSRGQVILREHQTVSDKLFLVK